jgi:hypothetical protein
MVLILASPMLMELGVSLWETKNIGSKFRRGLFGPGLRHRQNCFRLARQQHEDQSRRADGSGNRRNRSLPVVIRLYRLAVYRARHILFPEAVIGGVTGQLGGLVYGEFSCSFLWACDQPQASYLRNRRINRGRNASMASKANAKSIF